MATKRKVTRTEYNQWMKWLKKQGYSGPFTGLTTEHDCVKLLAKELKKEPPTILETQPRDSRTIASNLTRYGRGRKLKRAEVTETTALPEKYLIDHYQKLHKVLERFYDELRALELSELSLLTLEDGVTISHSYVSEMRVPAIIYEEGTIKLDVEESDPFLWECLEKHLIAEFPEFSQKLGDWKRDIAALVEECHDITKTIVGPLAKMSWDSAEPYLSRDSKDYGPGVYHNILIKAIYECVIANYLPQFQRVSGELVIEYPTGGQAIARGDNGLLDEVEQHCLDIVSDDIIKEKVEQVLNLAKQAEDTLKPIKKNLRLVLERGTFGGVCPICSDLATKSD